jgi:hypothetical protein
MHGLRHWYSSCLQGSGVSLAGVVEFLGHSRKAAPLAVGVYGHVTEETFENARNAVDRTLFRLRPGNLRQNSHRTEARDIALELASTQVRCYAERYLP